MYCITVCSREVLFSFDLHWFHCLLYVGTQSIYIYIYIHLWIYTQSISCVYRYQCATIEKSRGYVSLPLFERAGVAGSSLSQPRSGAALAKMTSVHT